MKKDFGILIYYFLAVCLGSVIGDFLYVQYVGCTSLVAGRIFEVTKELVFIGFFRTFPVVLIVVPFLITLYKIRHIGHPVVGPIVFGVLCAINWLVIFPFEEISKSIVFDKIDVEKVFTENNWLTEGYIRKSGTKTYFFKNNSIDDKADVLMINDSSDTRTFCREEFIDVGLESDFAQKAYPFRDPLVKASIIEKQSEIYSIFKVLNDAATICWSNGYIAWICFSAFGFALACSFVFIRVSAWRLISALYVSVSELVLILMNYFYFTPYWDEIRIFFEELLYGKSMQRFTFFTQRGVQLPLVIMNVFSGILILSIGIVLRSINNRKDQSDEN